MPRQARTIDLAALATSPRSRDRPRASGVLCGSVPLGWPAVPRLASRERCAHACSLLRQVHALRTTSELTRRRSGGGAAATAALCAGLWRHPRRSGARAAARARAAGFRAHYRGSPHLACCVNVMRLLQRRSIAYGCGVHCAPRPRRPRSSSRHEGTETCVCTCNVSRVLRASIIIFGVTKHFLSGEARGAPRAARSVWNAGEAAQGRYLDLRTKITALG